MLVQHINSCIKHNQRAVLATIIKKEGSSYRQVGAKCIIFENGTMYGVLSGGCIEDDVAEHAKEVFRTKQPKHIYYDLRNDEDTPWGMGVGCNGMITIWLGLIDPIENRVQAMKILEIFRNQYNGMNSFFLGTVLASDHEEILPLNTFLTMENNVFKKEGIVEGVRLTDQGESVNATIFLEKIKPIPNIIIFGAGQDAESVVTQMKQLKWQVTVVDHRPGYLIKDNFPYADDLHLVKREKFPNTLTFNRNTFAILMTHHFESDLHYLKGLINKDISYIGLLGPKRRFNQLQDRLTKDCVTIPPEVKDIIHTPIGLDIGSETPEEIALSIAAEIMSHKNLASNHSLKEKESPIHI